MITVVIFSVFLAQSSASFFGQLTGALGSVKSSIGKLFSDMGHDLKETYDCTVDAVEELIYDQDQISKYYDKCKTSTQNDSDGAVKDAPQSIYVYISPIITVSPKETNLNEVTTKSVNLLADKKDIEKKLASVEEVVNNEYYRVGNMSSHIEHEFDDLAKNVDMELKKIEEDKIDLHMTLRGMEKLHVQEEVEIEQTKDEIRQAFDEILKKIDNSPKESHLKNEIESIVGDMEKNSSNIILEEIKKWKEKEMEELEDLKNFKKDVILSTRETNMPRTFKDVVAKVSKDTSTLNPNNISNYSSTESQASSTKATLSLSETTTKASNTTISSSTEPVTPISTTSTVASIKPVTAISSSTTVSSIQSQASSPTTTASATKPVTQFSITTTIKTMTTIKSTTEPINQVSTTMLSTVTPTGPVTQAFTSTTTTPVTRAPITSPLPSMEPISATRRTTLKPKKQTKKPIKLNQHKLTTAKHRSTKTTTTPRPSDDYDGLVPKDPRAAAAEALKIFGKSIKTKSILDNFLKHYNVENNLL